MNLHEIHLHRVNKDHHMRYGHLSHEERLESHPHRYGFLDKEDKQYHSPERPESLEEER